MKVFVLGRSGSGKTPMATHLAARLGIAHVRASAWVRAAFPGAAPAEGASVAERDAFVAAITRFASDELARDPWASIGHLAEAGELGRPCVIESVRNPLDFVHLYDPRGDVVVWLEPVAPALTATGFERGLDVIDAYLGWLADAGLADRARAPVWRYPIEGFRRGDAGAASGRTLDDAIDDAAARLAPILAAAPAPPPRPAGQRVHAQVPADWLPPLEVRDEYLYGMDPARAGGYTPCRVFALSSYPGEAPTFQLRLPDGAVFSYVPAPALCDRSRPGWGEGELTLAELVYHDCPDERVVVQRFEALAGRVLAYVKQRDRWIEGDYRFTVEWWTGNHLLHVIALDNGQIAMLPHHKLKFGDLTPGFAPYRKLRKVWRVAG